MKEQTKEELVQRIQELETSFTQHQRYMQVFLQSIKGVSYQIRIDGKMGYIFGAVEETTGYQAAEFLQGTMELLNLVHPYDIDYVRADNQSVLTGEKASSLREYRIINRDGSVSWIQEFISTDEGTGPFNSIRGMFIDNTENKQMKEKLQEKSSQLDGILKSLEDVVWSITPDTRELLYLSSAADKVYGYPVEAFFDDPDLWTNILHPDYPDPVLENFSILLERGSFQTEFRIIRGDGEERILNRRAYFGRDSFGTVARIDGIDMDVTARWQAEERLRYLSTHDILTDLYNRAYFEQEFQRIKQCDSAYAVIIICDVDGLKLVNDQLGHDEGDHMLADAAQLLKRCFRQKDMVARIGGDEFAFLIEDEGDEMARQYVDRIQQALNEHNAKPGKVYLKLSIGYAAGSCEDLHNLFVEADQKMYQDKKSNREQNYKRLMESIESFK